MTGSRPLGTNGNTMAARAIRISVVVLLAASSLWFSLAPLRGLFWLHGASVGVTADSGMHVIDVDPTGPAYRSGLRVGDRLDAATSFENRLYLQNVHNLVPGYPVVLHVKEKNGSLRRVKVVAEMMMLDAVDIAEWFPLTIAGLVFIVVGSILILLRPSLMTWAFFLYCIAAAPGLVLGEYWLPAWLVYATGVFVGALQALGSAVLLVFCVRVPNDHVIGAWRYVEWIGAPVVFVSSILCAAIIDLSIVGVWHADVTARQTQAAISSATYVVGLLALVATFCRERGAERNRVAWIIAGLTIAFGAYVTVYLTDPGANVYTGNNLAAGYPSWLAIIPLFEVALPLTVAYAVIRHHALNVGLVANRTLVYGLFACAGFAAFALLDLLATKRFARNQFEIGLDVAIALAIGLSFQFVHPRTIRLIDRVFLPERYHSAIALEKLRNSLSLIRGLENAPNRAVETVAKELMLSSLAVFKKLSDGGFVRFAAAGWPKDSAWHIFAGDQLVQSFGSSTRVRSIDAAATEQLRIPLERDRPSAVVSLSPQTAGESLLLIGVHINGRRPDRDEVRGIASLLHEFVQSASGQSGRSSTAES
jgi:hypothetical protein